MPNTYTNDPYERFEARCTIIAAVLGALMIILGVVL